MKTCELHICTRVLSVFLCFCVFPVFAEESDPPQVRPESPQVRWTQVYRGISLSENTANTPRRQHIHILRIDLHEKGVSFFTTPRRLEQFESGKNETVRQRTNEFLDEHKLQAAVNANFFAVPQGEAYARPGSSDLLGAAVSGGIVVSKPSENYRTVFAVDQKGTPFITANLNSEEELGEFSCCVSGNVLLLEGGEIVPHSSTGVHPRTAVGVSKDKRYVYLLVIDGRQNDHSEGATYGETAFWLRFYGAWDGLNLDGGGSTTMVLQGESGQAKILNRPSDRAPRYNGNNLGVRARPLSQPM